MQEMKSGNNNQTIAAEEVDQSVATSKLEKESPNYFNATIKSMSEFGLVTIGFDALINNNSFPILNSTNLDIKLDI